MAELRHRYVLELVGAHIREPYRIITRFCPGRSLFDRLHKSDAEAIGPHGLTAIAYQIATGMLYLHEHHIVHRDLKTMNILLDDYDNAKIADFGLAGSIRDEKELSGGVGTPHYTAPEILERKKYGPKVDVYSFGVMLWEMATRTVPFLNKTHIEIIDLVVNKNWRLPFTEAIGEPMRALISACWSRRPSDRPDFREIIGRIASGVVRFEGCRAVSPALLDPAEPCPPLDIPYLAQTFRDPACPHFTPVVSFLVAHIDDTVRKQLREAHVLDGLTADAPDLGAVLALAAELVDAASFDAFFERCGRTAAETLLARRDASSAAPVVRFCLGVPAAAKGAVLPFLDRVIEWIDDPGTGPLIIRFLSTLPAEDVMRYKTAVLGFFTGHGLEDLSEAADVQAVTQLLPHFIDAISPEQLQRFADILERGIDIPVSLINLLIRHTPGEALSRLAFAVVRASARTDVSAPLAEILQKCTPADLEAVARQTDTFEAVQKLFEERRMIGTALQLLFYLVSVRSVPATIAQHPILTTLLQIDGHRAQRLQVLTALVSSEEFCASTTIIEGIQKLLVSSITIDAFSEYCLLLIGALSSHVRGCLLIQETGLLSLFSQLFLSSNIGDTTTPYSIIRNAARGGAEIPQLSLIVSCMMQDLVYSDGHRSEILITLRELALYSPDTIQEHDLQNSILPLVAPRRENRETAETITLALNLLAACEMEKLRGFYEKLCQRLFEVLNTDALLYPQLIAAAINLIGLMSATYELETFVERTGFVAFAQYVKEEIAAAFPEAEGVLAGALRRLSSSSPLIPDDNDEPGPSILV
jgi:hypothetical protein